MHYIALVGGQPMPVLLPLWQENGYSSVQLIASETTIENAENIKSIIEQDESIKVRKVNPTIVVDAYDLEKTTHDIIFLVAHHKYHKTTLNLTGGTKIMGIAAQQAAHNTKTDMLYVSTEKHLFYHFSAESENAQIVPIKVKISVDQYLNAHGLESSDSQNFGLRECQDEPPKDGDELETRVFELASQSGLFDDVRRNVFIRKFEDQTEVINELDVVVTHNGNMAICSCKSGIVNNQALYELLSLSRIESLGIYAGKVLASSRKTLPPGVLNRAKQNGIQVISSDDLDRAAQIIYNSIH